MIPVEVFHYTTSCKALKILLSKQLRFGKYEFTNDPKESKEWVIFLDGLGIPPTNFNLNDTNKIYRRISEIKFKEWKVLCMSRNHARLEDVSLTEKSRIEEFYPFLSGYSKPRMWAFYASENNKHTGVCLKFNGIKLNQRITEKFSSPYRVYNDEIKYDDEKLFEFPHLQVDLSQYTKNLTQKAREHVVEYNQEYFFLKSKDWESENEFRWVINSKKDKPEYISIEGTLEEVMLGADYPKDDSICIIKACEELRVPVGEVQWTNGTPVLKHGVVYSPSILG